MVKEPKPRTKVVVRKLPPHLSPDSFWEVVNQFVPEKYSWSFFVPGKISQKYLKHSRAYIDFKEPATVFDFKAKFEGHIFVSDKGAQYRASVEYAPFQKVPLEQQRKDPRQGTLEKDPDYVEFCKRLEGQLQGGASAEASSGKQEDKPDLSGDQKVIITPLMQAIIEKHSMPKRAVTVKPKVKQKLKKVPEMSAVPKHKQKAKRPDATVPTHAPAAEGRTAGRYDADVALHTTSKGKQREDKTAKENKKTPETTVKTHDVKESAKGKKGKATEVKQRTSDAPTTVHSLKAAAQEAKDAAAAALASSGSSSLQQQAVVEDSKKGKLGKNARVREGFELWMPKRVGRLTTPKEDKT